MKQLLFLLTTLLLISLLGCSRKTDTVSQLLQADSLMSCSPDSALTLLEDVPEHTLNSETDRAYYALLLTQARDKSFILQTDDSLIRTAVSYYSKVEKTPMRARAYYLWGSVLRDKQEYACAVEKYLTAAECARRAGDLHLLGKVYNHSALLYYRQSLPEKADSIYALLEQVATQINDTVLLIDALVGKGSVKRKLDDYEAAERLLLHTWKIASDIHHTNSLRNVSSSLSLLYSNMKKGKKALYFARKNYALQADTTTCYWTFSLLGEAYYHTEQYDSAVIFLKKALPISNLGVKADIYMRLADVAKNLGNIRLSLEYERLYSAYTDSVRVANQGSTIVAAEKEVIMHGKQRSFERFINKYRYALVAVLAVSAVLFFLFHKRHGKKIQIFQHLLDEQTGNEAQLVRLREEQRKLKAERTIMVNDLFSHAKVYEKMKRIIADYKEFDKSEEKMEEEDWRQLVAVIDSSWENLTIRLRADYQLKENEVRLCCLTLTDLPASYLHCLLGCSRDNIYKWRDKILEQRMGYPHRSITLREALEKLQ